MLQTTNKKTRGKEEFSDHISITKFLSQKSFTQKIEKKNKLYDTFLTTKKLLPKQFQIENFSLQKQAEFLKQEEQEKLCNKLLFEDQISLSLTKKILFGDQKYFKPCSPPLIGPITIQDPFYQKRLVKKKVIQLKKTCFGDGMVFCIRLFDTSSNKEIYSWPNDLIFNLCGQQIYPFSFNNKNLSYLPNQKKNKNGNKANNNKKGNSEIEIETENEFGSGYEDDPELMDFQIHEEMEEQEEQEKKEEKEEKLEEKEKVLDCNERIVLEETNLNANGSLRNLSFKLNKDQDNLSFNKKNNSHKHSSNFNKKNKKKNNHKSGKKNERIEFEQNKGANLPHLFPININKLPKYAKKRKYYLTIEGWFDNSNLIVVLQNMKATNFELYLKTLIPSIFNDQKESFTKISKIIFRSSQFFYNVQQDVCSLKCPISMDFMEFPARGKDCKHLQCFDLKSYLKLAFDYGNWNCPCCSQFIPSEHLSIDGYILSILKKNNKNSEYVTIYSNGEWDPLKKTNENQNQKIYYID
ncbi:tonalli isoform b [Anaeramoeba flamelloides]|uniref:Tonalli isoform b n=1 Tax=Anaeramoeba flamelloides TaxID=1746091 RepID=A0AAV7ZKV9_9EUKA|nr:tonalli isoform b [Anaeramoeba flamelloides]